MIALVVLVTSTGSALAGRRRVVVLDFEGEKAEKFHDAVVKVIKKTHTVLPTDKWNGEAESLSAEKVNDKNVKKVAKKLKVDGVIEGKVEKRRDEYIIRIKLRSGTTGEVIKPVNTKAENTKLDGDASDSIKDELVAAISELESNRDGSDDDEEKPRKSGFGKKKDVDDDEEKSAKKKVAKADDEEKSAKKKKADDEEKPAKKKKADDDEEKSSKKKMAKSDDEEKSKKKKADDDEEKSSKKKMAKSDDEEKSSKKKKSDDEEKSAKKKKSDDEEKPAKKKSDDEEKVAKKKSDDDAKDDEEGAGKKKKKKVATAEDGDVTGGVEVGGKKMSSEVALSPSERAIEVVVGASFNARRLSFNADADLGPSAMGSGRPPSYKGLPVTGAFLDLTVFPLAITHSSEGMLKNIGINVMSDKVLIIKSKDATGKNLDTSMGRYAFGAAFRYPLGKGATAPLVGGKLRYGRQNFTIAGNADVPNVNYTIIDPSVFFKYPFSPKMSFNAEVGYMVISNAGAIQRSDQYGASSVNGLEAEVGADYVLAKQLFARAAFRFETIGHTFKGAGAMTTGRDTDGDIDVHSARDTYFGGVISVGLTY